MLFSTNNFSRRRLLTGTASLAALPLVGCAVSGQASNVATRSNTGLNLEDPIERARIRAAIIGSSAKETVHSLYRLHIYAYLNDGHAIPFCSMYNYNVSQWEPLGDGKYKGLNYEVGVYTEFDKDNIIETWKNPVTGENREVWPFIGGPISVVLGPDGLETGELATVKPDVMQIAVTGGSIFIPTQSAFAFPNPLKPEVWPKESSGDKYYWDSFYSISASISDVANPSIASVPSQVQFQNLVSWHPWFGMGQRPGKTFGRAFGGKLANGVNDLPPHVLAGIEKQTPEILDIDAWKAPRNDFFDFMRERRPS